MFTSCTTFFDRKQQPLARRQFADAVAGMLHRLTRGPAGEESEVAGAARTAAHVAVMEAEEVEALASFPQMHDPRLGLLRLKAELGQDRPERRKRLSGLRFRPAHHDKIVRVAAEHAVAA